MYYSQFFKFLFHSISFEVSVSFIMINVIRGWLIKIMNSSFNLSTNNATVRHWNDWCCVAAVHKFFRLWSAILLNCFTYFPVCLLSPLPSMSSFDVGWNGQRNDLYIHRRFRCCWLCMLISHAQDGFWKTSIWVLHAIVVLMAVMLPASVSCCTCFFLLYVLWKLLFWSYIAGFFLCQMFMMYPN